MILVNKNLKLLIVKRRSVVDKWIKFNGKIFIGLKSSILGGIEAEEVYTGKNCSLRLVKARKIVLGAFTTFEELEGEDILIQNSCKGKIVSGKFIKVSESCEIDEIKGKVILINGNSLIGKIEGEKVLAGFLEL